jgi:hypothetical protein
MIHDYEGLQNYEHIMPLILNVKEKINETMDAQMQLRGLFYCPGICCAQQVIEHISVTNQQERLHGDRKKNNYVIIINRNLLVTTSKLTHFS